VTNQVNKNVPFPHIINGFIPNVHHPDSLDDTSSGAWTMIVYDAISTVSIITIISIWYLRQLILWIFVNFSILAQSFWLTY
jgi:hypothetical protein